MAAEKLISDHLDLWTAAIKRKSSAGRGSSSKVELYGIKKLRELILELAVRGLLVPQDPTDEPASELLKKIAAEKVKLVKAGNIKQGKPLPSIAAGDQHLPSGWSWACMAGLGEIAPRNVVEDNVITSFVPMPLVSTTFEGRHGHEARTWTEIKKGYTHFADGDIAIAKITPCFENSKAAIFSGLHNGVGAGTTELHVVRPFGEFSNNSYLLLYLKSPQFLLVGETKMTGSAGQKRVPTEFFSFNPLPLPPLAEQHRIVAKVHELMALCDQLEKRTGASLSAHQTLVETLSNALTNTSDHAQFASAWQRIAEHFDTLFTTKESIDQLRQTILQLAVMGKLVPPDPNDEPASELLKTITAQKQRLEKEGKIKKEKPKAALVKVQTPFEVPDRWRWIRLGDIFSFLNGYAFKSEWFSTDGIRLLRNINISPGKIQWKDCAFISLELQNEFERFQLASGDVVISLDRPIISSGLKYAIISERDVPCLLLQRVAKFEPLLDLIEVRFLSLWLESNCFTSSIDPGRSNGVPHISTKQLESTVFPLVSAAEQRRIVAKVDALMVLCDQLQSHLSNAQTTQCHLADAMTESTLSEA
jgi:type I restriction enzyme S subunit